MAEIEENEMRRRFCKKKREMRIFNINANNCKLFIYFVDPQ